MKRFFALVLAFIVCAPLFYFSPAPVSAATALTKIPNPVMTMTNLGTNKAVQQIYFYNDKEGNRYVFVTQRVTSNLYLSRCLVSDDGLTANCLDYVVLSGYGHGEALAVHEYEGQVYVWVGSNSITDTTDEYYASQYWARNASRLVYTPDPTAATGAKITEEKRLNEFLYASATGSTLYSGARIYRLAFSISPNSDRIMFWIKLRNGSSYKEFLCCYTLSALNAALSAASSTVSMSTMGAHQLAKIAYDGSLPNGSMQGLGLYGTNTLYISGGSSSQTPTIHKYTYTSSSITLKEVWTVPAKTNVEIEVAYMLNGAFYCVFIDDTSGAAKKNNTKIYTLDDFEISTMQANHKHTLKNLPLNSTVQNFAYTPDMSEIYVSQSSGGNTYISRCVPQGNVAVMRDYIVLNSHGIGESLEVDKSLSGKTYLWVGNGPVSGSDYYSTTVSRLEYSVDPSATTGASYSEVTVTDLAYANATATALDSTAVSRTAVSCTTDGDNRIAFRTQFASGDIYYTIYVTSTLNTAINTAGGTTYSLKNATSTVKSSFCLNDRPYGSFQGFDADGVGSDAKFLYMTGGSGSKLNLPLIYKYLYTNGGNTTFKAAYRVANFMQTAQGVKVYNDTIYVAIQPISNHKNQTVIRYLSTAYVTDPVISDDFSLRPLQTQGTVADGMLVGATTGTNAATAIALFSNTNTLRILDLNGNAVGESAVIGTGFTLQSLDHSGAVADSVTVVISGDTNGDGMANTTDCLINGTHISGGRLLTGCFLVAGDMNGDGLLSTTDYSMLENKLQGGN